MMSCQFSFPYMLPSLGGPTQEGGSRGAGGGGGALAAGLATGSVKQALTSALWFCNIRPGVAWAVLPTAL